MGNLTTASSPTRLTMRHLLLSFLRSFLCILVFVSGVRLTQSVGRHSNNSDSGNQKNGSRGARPSSS